MAIGETAYVNSVREQLLAGRARLADVLEGKQKQQFEHLFKQVDEALERIEQGTFGICEECHTDIGEDWLRQDPLTKVCLEHMTPKQQRALEYDLELAAQIQKGLLPPVDFRIPGWQISYNYEPAGVIGGDYCDLMEGTDGELHFLMADVSGKGVAAAMLSSNLRAIFRSLIPLQPCAQELMKRANSLFRQNALPSQYATLIYGKSRPSGDLEIINAGHLPVLLAGETEIRLLESANPPFGMFAEQEFTVAKAQLNAGDTLVLYTDGISEAENDRGDEYGTDRLQRLIAEHCSKSPQGLIDACREQLSRFRGARERFDDETILAIQYAPTAQA